jgi:hypothetical protein
LENFRARKLTSEQKENLKAQLNSNKFKQEQKES